MYSENSLSIAFSIVIPPNSECRLKSLHYHLVPTQNIKTNYVTTRRSWKLWFWHYNGFNAKLSFDSKSYDLVCL